MKSSMMMMMMPPRPPLDLYGGNTPAENSRHIAQANDGRYQNRRLRERERQISNILREIVKSRKSSMDINFPDTPPATHMVVILFLTHYIVLTKQVFYFSTDHYHPYKIDYQI